MEEQQKEKINTVEQAGQSRQWLIWQIVLWLRKKIWKGIVSIGIVVGIVAAYFSFAPSVVVSSYLPLDPDHPFANLFKVSNNSWLPITSIKYPCTLNRVEFANHVIVQGLQVQDVLDDISKLAPTESHDVRCPIDALISDASLTRILTANIEFVVSFNYPVIPWRTERYFCFQTRPDNRGQLHWISKPC